MKARQLEQMGIPASMAKQAKWLAAEARKSGLSPDQVRLRLKQIIDEPGAHRGDEHFGQLATAIARSQVASRRTDDAFTPRDAPAPWRQWGDDLDENAIEQMRNAASLPVAVRGALMPDAHLGYGLPIGGVLATDNAVIPYAVGVDIACRMKMTVLDLPATAIKSQPDRLVGAIKQQTRFGMGAQFHGTRRDHDVLDDDWTVSPVTQPLKDKAHAQLGTSGSGNHFVEFGIFAVDGSGARMLHLDQPGEYLALLSHSGSRGVGAQVAGYYSKLAMSLHPQLPKPLRHLAWLDMDTHDGQEYWHAMQLMGKYAAANHALIHKHVTKHLGAQVLADVENHHNFAWRETHQVDGQPRELIVHRKGATPAGAGVLGVIPGSMTSPCYVVRGKGEPDSLASASHGAGRVMSRKKAKLTYRWSHVKAHLKQHDVTLISAGIDEGPMVYKNIDDVMSAQTDLVDTIARFDPKIVKMAPEGEWAED
jgi:tRNA-splicing ligase RtcB